MSQDIKELEIIEKILSTPGEEYPAKKTATLKPLFGCTLAKTGSWWKAIMLVEMKTSSGLKHQLRLYGWQKNKNGEWKNRQKFNISKAKYVNDIIDIMQIFAPIQRKEKIGGVVGGEIYLNLLGKIDSLEKELKATREERKLKYISNQKKKISEMQKELKKFQKLLSGKKNERILHSLLKKSKNSWFFGPDYKEIYKEKWITTLSRNDFLLKKHDEYVDMVELKDPKDSLFDNKLRWSTGVKNGVSQLMFYLSEARKKYLSIKDEIKLEIFLPKGFLIIGRRPDEDTLKERLKIHNEFLNKIEILTYDDLLDRAKQTLNIFKGK